MGPITLGLAALIGSIVTGISSATANIVSSGLSYKAGQEANATNLELTKMANESSIQQVREANAFTAAQAQIDRDRQDTQMQRAMADYEAAGLNPLMAVSGSTAGYASPVSAQGQAANIKAGKVNPVSMDFSGMANAFSSMSNTMLVAALLGRNADKIIKDDPNDNGGFRKL